MPHMPFVARPTLIHRHALCLELRILIEIFPGIILSLISLLSLPGAMLACIVFRVRLERWNLVEVFVSFVTHVLFLYFNRRRRRRHENFLGIYFLRFSAISVVYNYPYGLCIIFVSFCVFCCYSSSQLNHFTVVSPLYPFSHTNHA